MKAVYITRYGGSDQLVYGPRQRPEPKSGQVLVRVRAAAVNPRDWILRDGRYVFRFALPRFPIILGSDLSGEVVKCGPSASRFRIGDEVFGMQPLLGGMGAYAEYVAIDETALARKPPSISHVDAAAVPCAGLTAWQALVNIGGVGQAYPSDGMRRFWRCWKLCRAICKGSRRAGYGGLQRTKRRLGAQPRS